jgi:hypothetical protein
LLENNEILRSLFINEGITVRGLIYYFYQIEPSLQSSSEKIKKILEQMQNPEGTLFGGDLHVFIEHLVLGKSEKAIEENLALYEDFKRDAQTYEIKMMGYIADLEELLSYNNPDSEVELGFELTL